MNHKGHLLVIGCTVAVVALLACSTTGDPGHPADVVGSWVYDTTLNFAITAADTTFSPADETDARLQKEFARSAYRSDPLRSGDQSTITDSLVLDKNGRGKRRTIVVVTNPRRPMRKNDSTVTFSAWSVMVDSETNLAQLCDSEAGYGPRECYGLRVIGGRLVFESRSPSGLPPSGAAETVYRRVQ